MQTVRLEKIKKQSYAWQESLRALRTNLQFCGDDKKVILFTSAMPDEGKSTVVVELARSLTESGKKVLVIDTDMRKSVLAGRLRVKVNKGELLGLSHYLSGQRPAGEVLYGTDVSGLFMVFAGPTVPNPTEILEKEYFQRLIEFGRETFDYVLIDTAPLGAAIDAALIAKKCDGAVLVVEQKRAGRQLLQGVIRQLELSEVKILGVVLNKVKKGFYGYGSYYGQYGIDNKGRGE